MRKTVNVSLPPVLARIVKEQAKAMRFASVSEYIRQLIREDLRHGYLRAVRDEEMQKLIAKEKLTINRVTTPERTVPSG